MAIRRDSLRAERDFYAPMTGGTEIRYSAAPSAGRQDNYSAQIKSRLAEIGKGVKRTSPIIEAIKVQMQKGHFYWTLISKLKRVTSHS